jgi:muramidase (phage lysozyme)
VERFTNKSPGALTMEQAIARHKKSIEEYKRQLRQARQLAAQGRGGDTEVAHVALGELVIPRALQSPELLNALQRAAAAHNIPLDMLKIGNAMNRINPNTGQPEFGILSGIGDWFSGLFNKDKPTTPRTFDQDFPGASQGLKNYDFDRVPGTGASATIPAMNSSLPDHIPITQNRVMSPTFRYDPTSVPGREADLSVPQVRAFLDTTAKLEGANYDTFYGGEKIPNLGGFPGYDRRRYNNELNTASGRYQINAPTYDQFSQQMGIGGFDPHSQDLIAAQLIHSTPGAMDAVKAGNMKRASELLHHRWSSFPDGDHPSQFAPQMQSIYEERLRLYNPSGQRR